MNKKKYKYFKEKLQVIKNKLKESEIGYNWQTDDYTPCEVWDKLPSDYEQIWGAIKRKEEYINNPLPEIEALLHDGNVGAEEAVYESFHIGSGYGLYPEPGDGYVDDIIDGMMHGAIFDEDACYTAYDRGVQVRNTAEGLHYGEY